jgi:E3 ubiquitin-protein ligase HUWE1
VRILQTSRNRRSLLAAVAATDFWTLLVKLDGAVYGKRGKSVQRSGPAGQSGPNPMPSESNFSLTGSGFFELSPLGQLMAMVAHPVIRRSQLLTDRLLQTTRPCISWTG